jgi:hypothetical protein
MQLGVREVALPKQGDMQGAGDAGELAAQGEPAFSQDKKRVAQRTKVLADCPLPSQLDLYILDRLCWVLG